MSKLIFAEKINGSNQTGIIDDESQNFICLCTKEKSEIILKAFKDAIEYAKLENKVAAFYDKSNGEESTGDLSTIGELTATHFGFIKNLKKKCANENQV